MVVKDSQGNEVELEISGSSEADDLVIDSAYYVNTDMPEEVEDSELDYIQDHYQAQMYEAWFEGQLRRAEIYMDMKEDR